MEDHGRTVPTREVMERVQEGDEHIPWRHVENLIWCLEISLSALFQEGKDMFGSNLKFDSFAGKYIARSCLTYLVLGVTFGLTL
jgi:hypothetical protein